MPIDIAIVADDLTGALDTATPFALSGLRIAAALRLAAFEAMVASGAEVLVANTASRATAPEVAAARVAAAGAALRAARPRIVFKKIDSRLKGNIAAETAALADAFGFRSVLVAPAIPDQGRPTVGGAVTGKGVATPIPIAPFFSGSGLAVEVADAATDADFDRLVENRDWSSTLAVGARGLGAALARHFHPGIPRYFAPHAGTLFAIGSHDPITLGQIAALRQHCPGLAWHAAPLGRPAGEPATLPELLQSTGDFLGPDEVVSQRFATGVATAVHALKPDTLVLSGGDTALAVLDALGASLVFPQGEAATGLPWFLIRLADGHRLRCVLKSGGFGGERVLLDLLPSA